MKTMKNLITLFAFVLTLSFSFAQTASISGDESTLKNQVEKGEFSIEMPESTEAEEINKSAEYYVDYFTVNYDDESKIAKISMVDNTPSSRRVINRLLLSNGVRTIKFNSEEFSINEFYDAYLGE
jgi:capsule polysaccharide export protein KpsE/RkpR